MFYTDFRCYLARGPAFTPPITLLELIVRPCCGRLDFGIVCNNAIGIATEQFSRPPHIGSVTQLRPHGVWLPAQQQPLHLKNQSHGSRRKINHWHLPLFYSPRATPIGSDSSCYSTVTIPLPRSCHHMSGASCHVDYIRTYYDFFLFPSCHLLSLYHPLSSFVLILSSPVCLALPTHRPETCTKALLSQPWHLHGSPLCHRPLQGPDRLDLHEMRMS